MDQHTVTRFYLEAFCDPVTPERQVWAAHLQTGTFKRRSPRKVATEIDYYSRTLPNGGVDESAEQFLGLLESNAAPVLRKIRGGHFALTDDARHHLAVFVAFMMVRVPSFRNYLEEAVGKAAEALLRTAAQHPDYFEKQFLVDPKGDVRTPEQVEALRQRALNAGTDIIVRGTRDLSLGYAFKSALLPVCILSRMRWQFLVSKEEPFITGDTPVTKRNDRIRPPGAPGLGLRHTEVTFPISPYICFRAGWTEGPPIVEVGTDRVVDLNRERVRYADKFVFASSEQGARSACETYAELRERGDAHARAISLMLIEEGGPPKPLV